MLSKQKHVNSLVVPHFSHTSGGKHLLNRIYLNPFHFKSIKWFQPVMSYMTGMSSEKNQGG